MVNDSYVYQLPSNVHDVYASFDCIPPLNVRGSSCTCLKLLTKFDMMELFTK